MDVVKDFEEKGAKPKIYGIPAYKTEDKKMEKQHPTASTPIHDNLATADFVTQPLVSPIQNHLTLPPVFPKATTGVNNIHGMPPPQNQNTVAPEPAHISPPTNQVNMISTNSPVLRWGRLLRHIYKDSFGTYPWSVVFQGCLHLICQDSLAIFQQWVIRRHCYQTCRDHMGTCP